MTSPVDFPQRRAELRLTRRGRIVVFVASVLALMAVLLASGLVTADAGDGAPTVATQQVVVQPGDSLWQIAVDVAPGVDPRAVVSAIREVNHLGTRPVVPGQVLVVPAYAAT